MRRVPDALLSSEGPSYSNHSSWEVLWYEAKEWAETGGVFKDAAGWGCAFVWSVYNLAHVYNTETPRLSVFDPHKQCGPASWGFACFFRHFAAGVQAVEREREREREALWVSGGGTVLEETAGCLPTGSDAAAGAVEGEHTCHPVRLTLFSLLVCMRIMDSPIHCQDVILYSVLPHMLTTAFQTGRQ